MKKGIVKSDRDVTLDQLAATSCDKEPIHIPGAIQSHGMLFSLSPTLKILQISENCSDFVEKTPVELLDASIGRVISSQSLARLFEALKLDDLRKANPLQIEVTYTDGTVRTFDGIINRFGDALTLELEKLASTVGVTFFSFYHSVRESVLSLQNAASIPEACQLAAQEVRRLSNFDRVSIYQFDERWNGLVVAEDRCPKMDSYLNQHFPASDIPAQARKLYAMNWLRLIANMDYTPVPLTPSLDPRSHLPLDLSLSVLRSVSPVHLQYMKNMGTQASMSVSIIKDEKLWGLFACHHSTPLYVSYQTRSACEFLGQIFSSQVSSLESRDQERHRVSRRTVLFEIDQALKAAPDLNNAFASSDSLLRLAGSKGAVLASKGRLYFYGICPSEAQVQVLLEWVKGEMPSGIFTSESLGEEFSDSQEYKEIASGLLALRISDDPETYILWFRPELAQTLSWAGNPKSKDPVDFKGTFLHPRSSFALWQEVERGRSEKFEPFEKETIAELRNMVLLKLVSKANRDLAESNEELDSFASVVSHDLKEPLRGMRNYTSFALEDCGDLIDEDSRKRLTSAVALGGELENLLTSLYDYSRMGRVELSFDSISLQSVLESSLSRLSSLISENIVEIRIPIPLPVIRCDRIRVGEIFLNLIANAIKYNASASKVIEITFAKPENDQPYIFCVKDNGLGIDPRHHTQVFKIFKRLHARHEFPGGTGSGLAIVKRIIDRHNGKIWIDSAIGKGSSFYFTFAPDKI